ncbi:hypothetical protein CDD82_5414 [Ophiocordyceps australis]|uniref:NACHT domain-containing protein n=1 Tax=Ophiocordyceps australis TaxID=1399860 RepID=A0A2C5ZUG8_9HYPO|nr:hypothetical protein CDD82_5414 [Ophiocordyceps australis]
MASKLMNKLRGKRPKASPQPQTQAASQSASPVPSSSIPEPQTLPARLWCQAYDELKLSHRKEVEAYEKILSTQLDQKRQSSTGALVQAVGNIIGQTHETRWRQMEELVQAGLERTRKEAAIKQGIDDKLQTVSAIKEIADKAVRAVPEAAIAWVGVCSGLEMLSNAVTAPGTNRQGMTYVISRMAWYWDLATLLLDENMAERSIKLRDELESHIVQLYQKLLLYQIRSICLYYRNQASIVLQDVIKVHDWTSQLKDIKDAEVAVKSDAEQYNTEQIKSRLDKLATVAQSREMKLQAIHASMQEQASSYEKRQQDSKDNECLRDLYVTNPGEDKERIEKTKGGLLKESYKWILSNKDFENWRNDEQSRLLWIKGDPGKGKTMLLCGIIDEIKDAMSKGEPEAPNLMAYFFCQTTDSRINNAISVLRSLIWMLVEQCESLISHVRKEYDNRGKALFEGPNAWVALSRILDKMLQDQCVGKVYIMIDALDECSTDLQDLLRLIVDKSCASSRFKWIVSSRNWPNIEQQLEVAAQKVRLCLELNQESISAAVKVYIHHEVERLAMIKDYDVATRNAVEHDVMLWDTLKTLSTFPPGLDSLYKRMLHQIIGSKNADVCKQMLAVASVVYRPLTLRELSCLVEMPQTVKDDVQLLEKMMKLCGSFLTLQEDIVYFVHQSAKDFVLQTAHHHLFPHGKQHTHGTMLSKSLDIMSRTLRADLYSLRSPGFPIEQVTQPEPDPLATARYSYRSDSIMCNYGAQVLGFVRKHLLHWFESLSLMGKLPEGILSISRLESKLAANSNDELYAFMYDAKRFILSHRAIIEKAPLQLYSSALIFTPQRSIVRRQFETDLPEWILRAPTVSKQWSPLLQALETGSRTSDIKFSPDNKLLAAATYGNIRLWDVETGVSLHILDAFPKDSDSRPRDVTSLAFTSDGKLLSLLEVWLQDSGYWRLEYCMAWDIATGAGTRVDIGQTAHESSKFKDSEYFSLSPDGKCIVACGGPQQGNTIHLWDIEAGAPPKALVGHSAPINNFSVSPDGKFIVSSSDDGIIKLWDSVSGAILHDLKGPLEHNSILSVATSGQLVASMDSEASSYVWDAATGNIIWEKKHSTALAIKS